MTNPLTNERDGTEVCVSTNCSGDACAYPDCQRDPADVVNVDHISAAHMMAVPPKRVAMLMSNPQGSALVRAMLDTAILAKADAELRKVEPLTIGGVEVDMRWTCMFAGKFRRVSDLVTHMKDDERQHYVFKPRTAFHGELIFIGPQLPNESRQVYRARLRHGVKTISR